MGQLPHSIGDAIIWSGFCGLLVPIPTKYKFGKRGGVPVLAGWIQFVQLDSGCEKSKLFEKILINKINMTNLPDNFVILSNWHDMTWHEERRLTCDSIMFEIMTFPQRL